MSDVFLICLFPIILGLATGVSKNPNARMHVNKIVKAITLQ